MDQIAPDPIGQIAPDPIGQIATDPIYDLPLDPIDIDIDILMNDIQRGL